MTLVYIGLYPETKHRYYEQTLEGIMDNWGLVCGIRVVALSFVFAGPIGIDCSQNILRSLHPKTPFVRELVRIAMVGIKKVA